MENRLDGFFAPRGIAIIGASAKAGSPGHQIVQHAARMGFKGGLYPVSPHREDIEGLKSYANVREIPGVVDMALIMVSPKASIGVAEDIAARARERGDLRSVVVGTNGYSELGTDAGRALEHQLLSTLNDAGVRVIGPNCIGVVDTYHGVNTSFSVPPNIQKGGVSILSQSGAFASSYLRWAKDLHQVGISKFVSVGNMSDVNMIDLLDYLASDDLTKSIAVYLEGIPDSRGFIEAAARVTKIKPITIIKSGKTPFGSSVAMSHTGSIAGNDAIYTGAFKQAGLIRATSVDEFYHTSRCFDKLPLPKGDRVCIITGVGGPSAICVDELFSAGAAKLAHLTDGLKDKLRSILSPAAAIGKPDGYIDMTASPTEDMQREVLGLLMADDNIDSIIYLNTPPGYADEEKLAQAIIGAYNSVPEDKRKPLLSVLLAGNAVHTLRLRLEDAGLPTFEFPDSAAHVMTDMIKYRQYKDRVEAKE